MTTASKHPTTAGETNRHGRRHPDHNRSKHSYRAVIVGKGGILLTVFRSFTKGHR